MTVATSLAAAIQGPLSGTLGGDEEKDEAIQDSKLAVVECREESTSSNEMPPAPRSWVANTRGGRRLKNLGAKIQAACAA